MAPLSRFFHPYFVANTALVLSWGVFRKIFKLDKLSVQFTGTFFSGEVAMFFLMTLYLYKKFKRCNTWDSFVSKSFFFYQTLIACMLFYVSPTTMVWFILACAASFFLFRPPQGATSSNIVELDDLAFETKVTSKESKGKTDGVTWVVFFTANWHQECTWFSYVFADLANKFGVTNKIKFGRIDDRYKSIFTTHKVRHLVLCLFVLLSFVDLVLKTKKICLQLCYQVVANEWKPLALPCVVMFKNGEELLRLPPFDKKGNVIATLMTEHGCTKYFGLEKRFSLAQEEENSKKKKL